MVAGSINAVSGIIIQMVLGLEIRLKVESIQYRDEDRTSVWT